LKKPYAALGLGNKTWLSEQRIFKFVKFIRFVKL
jgi:hypothetical protein